MSKPQPSPQKKYTLAVKMAKEIAQEMAGIYAGNEILKKLNEPKISHKFYNTYAGQVWNVIRSTTADEILIAIARILTDRMSNVTSLKNLFRLINNENVKEIMRKNYTLAPETFDEQYTILMKELSKIDGYIKHHPTVKSLRIFRNNHLAHRAQKTYTGTAILKWGDEDELIEILARIITPMEHVLLNAEDHLSRATKKNYEFYAKEFWESFTPPRSEAEAEA